MGLIDGIKNKVSQGILGTKAIQPYNQNNGLLSKINRYVDGLVDTVKGIPTFMNDALNIKTFIKDVSFANKYANYKKYSHELLTGRKYKSNFADLKEGYRFSKRLRTDPNISPDMILNPTAKNSLVEVKPNSMARYARELMMTPRRTLTHDEPIKEDVNKNKAMPVHQE